MATGKLQSLLLKIEADIRRKMPDVTFEYARTGIAAHGAPPRIVWVPAQGSFGPAAMLDDDSDNPRQVGTDNAAIEVHCWAADDELGRDGLAEQLAHAAYVSIRDVTGRSFTVHANERGNSELSAQGWLYKFLVSFAIPITEDEYPTATITDMPFDDSSPPPDGVLQAPGDD